ncbi:hypothetical protein INQ25_04415 [Wolbachia endosymbiont of Rhagoletis cerasi]|uniref:hypothetical protein n=1 Tax=Wolbachia endosymbiont of Rhagoletis cerasi TaxID=225363 RepID=UPI001BD49D81|nr:hypothetical protein [Wolbachia endosymbiont of Rhagoletis cerasi]MBS9530623.1 hypothetical protein [Wolbachia endosymbiont of Rhagoletis cerasi]
MSVYQYFRRYVEYGVVPAKRAEDCTLVPENSFYKSVHYVDNILGPVKDVICGVESKDDYNKYHKNNDKCEYVGHRAESVYSLCTLGAILAANIILQPLFLMVAYLSYLPVKLLSKITGDYCFKTDTKSFVDYSNMFLEMGQDCADTVSRVFNKIVSYACAAIIWAAALMITPLMLACDKVQSKLSEIQEPEKYHRLSHWSDSETTLVNGIPQTEL